MSNITPDPAKTDIIPANKTTWLARITPKNFLSIVAGGCVTGLAAIALVVPADHLALLGWKVSVISLAVMAVLALVAQGMIQSHEDRARENRESERDADLSRLVEIVGEMRLEQQVKYVSPQLGAPHVESPEDKKGALQGRVRQLGNDLFAFLKEKGPYPEVVLDKSKSMEDQIRSVMEVRGPYVEAVHFGYFAHFRDRVVQMFNELAEHGIKRPDEILPWEIDPPEVQNAERIKKIAGNLFLIAAKMDIDEAAKGT